jgi:hypothetical protein
MTTSVLNGLTLNGQRIQSVADPTSSSDAATKSYVDNFVQGLTWKTAVVAASTANVTVSSAPASLDGISLTANARVLLKNQTTATENGIYAYASTGAALTRVADMASGVDARGFVVAVRGGTTNDDTIWHVTSDPAVVGTDAITWSQLPNAGATYVAGAGLTESPAGTFNVGAGNGITVNADDVAIASSAAGGGLTYTTGVLAVGAGSGITVNADDVAIATTAAGNGLTISSGVLNVGASTGITVAADTVAVDTSVVARKVAANVGDGTATQIDVTHSLGTYDIVVELFTNSGVRDSVIADVSRFDTNTVRLNFATAPTSAQYRVVIHG